MKLASIFRNRPALGRELHSLFTRLGISFENSRRLVHLIKFLKRPIASLQRTHAYVRIKNERNILIEDGFAFFTLQNIGASSKGAKKCLELWEARCKGDEFDSRLLWADKYQEITFLRNCLLPNDLNENPEILELILNKNILEAATYHLKTIPILASAQIWWSTSEATAQGNFNTGSQQFHLDQEDKRQLKVFIFLNEIHKDNGPFTFYTETDTEKIKAKTNYKRGRLDEVEIDQTSQTDNKVVLLGKFGEGLAVDTSQCLHMGSRVYKGERLVLMLHFVPYNVHLEPKGLLPGKFVDKTDLSSFQKMICVSEY
jgi:hypothetical protein